MSRLRWDPYPGTALFVVVIVLVAGVPGFVEDRAGVNVWWSLAAVVFSLVQLVCLGWLFWWALLGGWRREWVHYVGLTPLCEGSIEHLSEYDRIKVLWLPDRATERRAECPPW